MVGVDEVQPDGGVLDTRLVGAWIADAHVLVYQDLGAAGVLYEDGLRHGALLWRFGRHDFNPKLLRTAQHAQGEPPHAWFTAFAPADAPRVAIAVIVEDGGNVGSEATGGRVAAPIARDVMKAVLGR